MKVVLDLQSATLHGYHRIGCVRKLFILLHSDALLLQTYRYFQGHELLPKP